MKRTLPWILLLLYIIFGSFAGWFFVNKLNELRQKHIEIENIKLNLKQYGDICITQEDTLKNILNERKEILLKGKSYERESPIDTSNIRTKLIAYKCKNRGIEFIDESLTNNITLHLKLSCTGSINNFKRIIEYLLNIKADKTIVSFNLSKTTRSSVLNIEIIYSYTLKEPQ